MAKQWSLNEIVASLGGEIVGDGNTTISRVASVKQASPKDITFINDTKYIKEALISKACAFVLRAEHAQGFKKPVIIVDNPYAYFAKLSALFNPVKPTIIGIADSVRISANVTIPATCSIAEQVVIGEHVVLGEFVVIGAGSVIEHDVVIQSHTKLEPNVTIKHHVTIGQHCHIFSGAVIGSDGFGYAEEQGVWIKIPQVGHVVIHDHVDIGANTTIDRGALDITIIEEGVKLDNLIQIGHNCVIGAHTVIAGCVGIAGSARIGRHCKIGGAAMVLGHLEVVDHVTISPGSMITRSLLQADTYTALMPFQSHKAWLSTAASIRQLNSLSAKIKLLEKEIALLKSL